MRTAENERLGRAWLDAFNRRDLEALLALYAADCVHTSPKLRVQRPETQGEVRGKPALRAWWADAFARLPGLRYEALSVTADEDRVVLEYLRHVPGEAALPVLELFEVEEGAIVASRVFHG
jgi:ketosteroid isomerase-like protein